MTTKNRFKRLCLFFSFFIYVRMAYKTSLYILLSSIGISNGEKFSKTKKKKKKLKRQKPDKQKKEQLSQSTVHY